jgi:hypothetical protein
MKNSKLHISSAANTTEQNTVKEKVNKKRNFFGGSNSGKS